MEAPQIHDLKFEYLPSHPDCQIAYTLKALKRPPFDNNNNSSSSSASSSNKSIIWLIFVNGLGLPQAFWQPTIQLLESDLTSNPSVSSSSHAEIYATTYDRYGQGLSRPPPLDNDSSNTNTWTPTRHDCLDAARELEELIHFLRPVILSSSNGTIITSTSSTSSPSSSPAQIQVILIAHSLGVPITRLFIQRHENPEIAGLILIDSNMANVNMVDLLPDPDNCGSEPLTLPSDTTMEQLIWTRANYSKLFAPTAPNAENIDRVSLLTLLPRSDAPVLSRRQHQGNEKTEKKKAKLVLTVIAHDPDAFAEEGLRIATRGLTREYIEPAWREYNTGLLRLAGSHSKEEEDDKRIVVASGAGHFVQRDNPRCVADEIWKVVGRVRMSSRTG